jgi:hypothetical protein
MKQKKPVSPFDAVLAEIDGAQRNALVALSPFGKVLPVLRSWVVDVEIRINGAEANGKALAVAVLEDHFGRRLPAELYERLSALGGNSQVERDPVAFAGDILARLK